MTPRLALLIVTLGVVLLPWLLWQVRGVRRWAPLAVLQIAAGVLLGPTGLGRIAPALHRSVFTPGLLAQLSGLATIGVLLYVFVAGLHLDAGAVRDRARRLAAPTLGSIAVPFALGLAAGWWMLGHVPGAVGAPDHPVAFVVAIAICTAVTALPVLAAMLQEMGHTASPLGQAALAVAAVNDAALWLMIAVLLALANGAPSDALVTVAATLLWLGAVIYAVRPVLTWLSGRLRPAAMLTPLVAAALASAALSDAIGLGYITGAFAAGVAVPHRVRAPFLAAVEPLTAAVLLPFFFVVTGLRAFIDPGSGAFLAVFALATGATVVGKILGTAVPARLTGTPWPNGLALGCLMQTKGLMEVLVLAVMADAGLIGPAVFSAMVAMAMVCTLIAAPLTRLSLALRTSTPALGDVS